MKTEETNENLITSEVESGSLIDAAPPIMEPYEMQGPTGPTGPIGPTGPDSKHVPPHPVRSSGPRGYPGLTGSARGYPGVIRSAGTHGPPHPLGRQDRNI